MLILTRRKGQAIYTSNGLVFRILKNVKGEVSIGIEAPDNVDIWREELVIAAREAQVELPSGSRE